MTLTELLAQCRVFLQDPSATRWSDAELTQWLNEAQDDFADRTKVNRTTATLSVAATTPANAFYTLPADLLSLERVTRNGEALDLTSIESFFWEGWEAETGTPYQYIYGPYGFYALRVYPYPAAPASLTAYYAKQLPRLSSGTDSPSPIPAPYHIALVHYALAKAYAKDFEYKEPVKVQDHGAQYADYVTRCVGNMPSGSLTIPYRHL